jgi:hypothetical protein
VPHRLPNPKEYRHAACIEIKISPERDSHGGSARRLRGRRPAAPPPRLPACAVGPSAARWYIEHRPGNWAQTSDEVEAVRQIDAAIGDLKQAAYNDGKNLNDHPPVDERPDHAGRIHESLEYLRKARADISSEEDNGNAQGWRNRAIGHIDGAIGAARRVFHE